MRCSNGLGGFGNHPDEPQSIGLRADVDFNVVGDDDSDRPASNAANCWWIGDAGMEFRGRLPDYLDRDGGAGNHSCECCPMVWPAHFFRVDRRRPLPTNAVDPNGAAPMPVDAGK